MHIAKKIELPFEHHIIVHNISFSKAHTPKWSEKCLIKAIEQCRRQKEGPHVISI